MLKRLKHGAIGALMSAMLLSGCQASTYQVPETCELPEMLEAFDTSIPGSQYVPVDWQPATGTQLKLFLDNAGLACTYGIQTAEVGGTVMWLVDHHGLWNAQVETWKSENYREIDIPGISENAAFLLPETATGVDGAYIWEVNILIDDLWISLGSSFIQDITEATDIINAAIEVAQR